MKDRLQTPTTGRLMYKYDIQVPVMYKVRTCTVGPWSELFYFTLYTYVVRHSMPYYHIILIWTYSYNMFIRSYWSVQYCLQQNSTRSTWYQCHLLFTHSMSIIEPEHIWITVKGQARQHRNANFRCRFITVFNKYNIYDFVVFFPLLPLHTKIAHQIHLYNISDDRWYMHATLRNLCSIFNDEQLLRALKVLETSERVVGK